MNKLSIDRVVFIFTMICGIATCFIPNAAHAFDYSGSGYEGNEARQTGRVQVGTILGMREIRLNTSNGYNSAGAVIGGTLGAVAGSMMGHGNGRVAAGALAGILGGFGGDAVQKAVMTKTAVEYIVALPSGEQIAIVQESDNQSGYMNVGDRVRLVQMGGTTRIARI